MAPRTPHDNAYKDLFSHPQMVRDLLRGFVPEAWIAGLDFETLEKLSASHISDDLRKRESDLIWRVRLHGRWLYVYLLLEFQSRNDPWMALRVMVYTGLLYQDLIRTGTVRRHDALPPVFPIVIYNGRPTWRAARDVAELIAPLPPGLAAYRPSQRYFLLDEVRIAAAAELAPAAAANTVETLLQIEAATDRKRLRELVGRLIAQLAAPEHDSLRRAMTTWLNRIVVRRIAPSDNPPAYSNLQEVGTMLEQTVDRWVRQWKREGLRQGREEGLEQGREEGREQGREQGREEGREEGRQEGLKAGQAEGLERGRRELLERQLARRFGTPLPSWVHSRLEAADAERLDHWAEAIFDASSLESLLAGK
ncbi:MAG: Rpn family recombination-promoting nuclease/putative transposase [Burkholderiales bacterium]|nr:Rpn family recombination-promoting nuclease/putative transposase [Burkholderiales bacterium]